MCTCCSVFVLQSERVSELWNLPLGHALEDVATGTMATGTVAKGFMATGTMATGTMATGKRGTGSGNNGQQDVATGTMATGTVAKGSMATGTMATGKRGTGSGNNGQQRITPTLVALIVVFTVCVGPSGLLDFFRKHQLIDLCTDSQNISRQSYDYLTIILR